LNRLVKLAKIGAAALEVPLFMLRMTQDMVPILLDGVKSGLYEIEEDGRIWSNYKKGYLNPS